MTELQTKWLLDTFFLPNKAAGAENIARKLIETGECLTTELARGMWRGGIGNFIEEKKSEEGIGLIKLFFDVNEFCSLDNEYFCSYFYSAEEKLTNEIEQKNIELRQIREIVW